MHRRDLLKMGFGLAASGLLVPEPIKRSWALDRTMVPMSPLANWIDAITPRHGEVLTIHDAVDSVGEITTRWYDFWIADADRIVTSISFFVPTPDFSVVEVRGLGLYRTWSEIAPDGTILDAKVVS